MTSGPEEEKGARRYRRAQRARTRPIFFDCFGHRPPRLANETSRVRSVEYHMPLKPAMQPQTRPSPSSYARLHKRGLVRETASVQTATQPHPLPRFCLLPIRSVTTAGSAKVEVSPSEPYSFSAILRKIRRMILPERVFGNIGAN